MAIEEKNTRLAAAGRKGGLAGGKKGGHSRMASLDTGQRSELARAAAQARWADPIHEEVIRKAKQMFEQIRVNGQPQRFYFDGKRAWHAVVGYYEEKRWEQHLLRTCNGTTTLTEIIEDVMSRR